MAEGSSMGIPNGKPVILNKVKQVKCERCTSLSSRQRSERTVLWACVAWMFCHRFMRNWSG